MKAKRKYRTRKPLTPAQELEIYYAILKGEKQAFLGEQYSKQSSYIGVVFRRQVAIHKAKEQCEMMAAHYFNPGNHKRRVQLYDKHGITTCQECGLITAIDNTHCKCGEPINKIRIAA